MANPFPPGSPEYYEEESRQNAARGMGMPTAAPVVAKPPTAANYVVPGAGGAPGQGPVIEDMTGGASTGAVAQAPVTAPVPTTTPEQSVANRVMLNQPGAAAQPADVSLAKPTSRYVGGGPVIPGKRTPAKWETTTEQGLDVPGARENLTTAQNQRGMALDLQAEQAKKEADITHAAKAEDYLNKWQASDEDKALQAKREYDLGDAKMRLREARANIDPNKFVANMSIGQKIATALSAFAGGVLIGMGKKQSNDALTSLQNSINQNVDLQLKNLQNADDDVKAFYGQWANEDQARAAGRKLQYEMAAAQLERDLAGAKSEGAQAQLLNAKAALNEASVAQDVDLAKATQGKVVTQQQDVMTKPTGGGGGRVTDWSATMADYLRKHPGADPEQVQKEIAAIQKGGGVTADQARSIYFGKGGRAEQGIAQETGGGPPMSEKEQTIAMTYGKRLEDSGAQNLAQVASQMRGIGQQAAPGERAPGFKRIDKVVQALPFGDSLISDQAYGNQTVQKNAAIVLGQIRSGASVSAQQAAGIDRLLGGRGTKEDWEMGANLLEAEAASKARAASAGVPPRIQQEVTKNYGPVIQNALKTRAPGEK